MTITFVSVIVALAVGGVEALGLLCRTLPHGRDVLGRGAQAE